MSQENPSLAPSSLDPVIRDRLHAFVARRRGLILLRGALGALAAWLGALICVAAADLLFLMEDGVRTALSLATYALALAVAWRIAGRPLRERADLGAAARWLEASDPKLREWVLAAVELGRGDAVKDSAAFRALVQQEVSRELSDRDIRQLLPANLVRRWARLAGVALLLVAILFALPGLPTGRLLARAAWPGSNLARVSHTHLDVVEPTPADVTAPRGGLLPVVVHVGGRPADEILLERFGGEGGRIRVRMKPIGQGRYSAALDADLPLAWYRVRGGDAMTRKYSITTVPAPHVIAFAKTYRYPGYTALPAKSVREAGGVLEAVEGTEVDLTLEVDQPVRQASLKLELGEKRSVRELADRGGNRVSATLRLEGSGTYHVHLVAKSTGFENTQSPVYEIRVTPDLVPAVELETPAADRSVAPDDVLALAGGARDDFGLATMRQEFQVNRQGWRVAHEWPSTQREARVSTGWDLLPLGLKSGDEVLVRLAALDRRGGRGESTTRRLVVGASGISTAKRESVAARQRVLAAMEKASQAGQELRKATETRRDQLRRGREEPAIREAQAEVAAAARALDQAAQEAEQAVRQALQKSPEGTPAREMIAVGRTLSRLRRADLGLALVRLPELDKQERPEAERNADEALRRLDRAQWEPKKVEQAVEKMLSADEASLAARELEDLSAEVERARSAARSEEPVEQAAAARRQSAAATHAESVAAALDEMAEHSNRKGELQRFAKELREAAAKSEASLAPPEGDKKRDPAAAADDLRNRTAQARDQLRGMSAQMRREADEARRNLENDLEKRPFGPLVQAVEQLAWKRDMKPEERARQGRLAGAARESVADQLRDQAALEELRRDSAAAERRELADEAAAVEQVQPDPADPKSAEAALKELKALAEAHEKLETGRDLAQAARQAHRLAEDERWEAAPSAAAVARGREWPAMQSDLSELERDVRESHLPDPAARAVAEARNSNEAREANDEMTRRNERQEAGRNLDRQLVAVAGKLDEASRAAEPGLAEARKQVSEMALSLADRLAAARDLAEAQRKATQAVAGKANAGERRAGALDRLRDQQELNRGIEAVRADLRHDAAAQDQGAEAGRERARDADDGLALLREPPPRAEDLLQQAAAAGEAEQAPLLAQTVAQQTALEQALGMLAYHYERLEKQEGTGMRRVLRQQEQQLGLKPALEGEYAKAEKLAGLQAQAPDRSAAALEKELAANPAMQRALDRLSREELNRAQAGLERAATGEQQLGRKTGQLADERQAQAQKLQQNAGDVARRAGELNKDRVVPAGQKAGELKSATAPEFRKASAQLAEAANRAPPQVAADPAAAARQMEAMAGDLKDAAAQLDSAAQDGEKEAQSGGSAEQQGERRSLAGKAREASGAASQLAREAGEVSSQLAHMQERETDGLRQQARQQPELTAGVADAAQEVALAARHQERLGRNAASPLEQVAKRATENAINELPSAGRALEQSPAARAALPAVEQAGTQAAQRADELKSLTAQLPPLAPTDAGGEVASAESSATWLARALDQADRSAESPGQQASALARAAQAQQRAMAQSRAQGQVPGTEPRGAPVQVAGRPGPMERPGSLEKTPENWARLPGQVAPEVRENSSEKVPEEYRAMVESYFKGVATEARKGSP